MFLHLCTACDKKQLIFPSQITGMANLDDGIVLAFTCWCGAEQVELTGRRADRPVAEVIAA